MFGLLGFLGMHDGFLVISWSLGGLLVVVVVFVVVVVVIALPYQCFEIYAAIGENFFQNS